VAKLIFTFYHVVRGSASLTIDLGSIPWSSQAKRLKKIGIRSFSTWRWAL